MSYDLFFYKRKDNALSEDAIRAYLNTHLKPIADDEAQWFYENEDTEVYFSFDQNEPESDPESVELWESYVDFDNTHFTFNLNFLRPDFFGQEAFAFVDKMIADLDLYVIDTQSSTDPDNPFKPDMGSTYELWSNLNKRHSKTYYEEMGFSYLDPQKSSEAWEFNYARQSLQSRLGDEYFVPKILFIKRKADDSVVTLSIWTQHIPAIIPRTDHYLLVRQVKKLFKTVEESGVVPSSVVLDKFKDKLERFDFPGCWIIHPQVASQIKKEFNSIPFESSVQEFGTRAAIDKLVNVKP